MKRTVSIFIAASLSLYLFLCTSALASGEVKSAPELTAECKFSSSSNEDTLDKLHDGKHSTAWTSDKPDGQYIQVTLPEKTSAAGVYIQWNTIPEEWTLLESSGGSVWNIVDLHDNESFINAYIPLGSETTKIRIESDSYKWKLSIAEVRVFGQGTLPGDVQVWQPSPNKADLMVVPAHPDDEMIYFGGTLPYYAGQLGKHTIVVYMTSSPIIRKFEALDGLWKVGVHEYPVFLPLANEYTSTVKDAELAWDGLDHTVELLAEQMRRFKPDVVVTHDLDGEYGHGAHKLTALAVEKAVDITNNPDKYTKSAEEYGVWQVKKCYLHLFSKKKIEMDWNEPLSVFNAETALDMAKDGYALHVSQHFRDRPIEDSGEYNNAQYGLYWSSVGPDTKGGDFFENIVYISATQQPAAAPKTHNPSVTAFITQAASATHLPVLEHMKASSGTASVIVTIVMACVLLLIAATLSYQKQKTAKPEKHSHKKK
jgi:LmbE family N-acetylglucosaminyl deacetylase